MVHVLTSKKQSSGKMWLCLRHGLFRDLISLSTLFTELKLKNKNYLLTEAKKMKIFSMWICLKKRNKIRQISYNQK